MQKQRSRPATIWIVALLLVGSLSACGDDGTDDSTTTTTNSAATETTTTVATISSAVGATGELSYALVDTGQVAFYDNSDEIEEPAEGEAFAGQDAVYDGNQASYTDNGDGTVTDNVTGLVWTQRTDTDGDGTMDASDKLSSEAAADYCESLSLAGYDDWQLPSIKQLYSLMDFTGTDPSGYEGTDTSGLWTGPVHRHRVLRVRLRRHRCRRAVD